MTKLEDCYTEEILPECFCCGKSVPLNQSYEIIQGKYEKIYIHGSCMNDNSWRYNK